MGGRDRRRIIGLAVALVLAVPWVVARPVPALAVGCPTRPWTLADIVRVPSLWGEVSWPPASARRVACFGGGRIAFIARGGMLNAVFPGVRITPAFGQPIFLASGPTTVGWDLNAWLPADIGMTVTDLATLDLTSPGGGQDGMQDVWWQGSGHFDDPAAADCRPDDGTSTVDGIPLVLTPAEAIELCRNEFVIDRLTWLPVPPTDTSGSTAQAPPSPWSPGIGGAFLIVAAAVGLLLRPARSRRRR